MSDELFKDFDIPQAEVDFVPEGGVSAEISDLSKQGYQLIKDNRIDEAKDAFYKILKIDENNNYALVGLGDAERKQGHFHEAVEY